jgi:hypothetical protein
VERGPDRGGEPLLSPALPVTGSTALVVAPGSVPEVDVRAVAVTRLDEVDESDRVVRTGDRSAVLGCDGDFVPDSVVAGALAGRERAEALARRLVCREATPQ